MATAESIEGSIAHSYKKNVLQIETFGFEIQLSFLAENCCRIRARHCGNKLRTHSYAVDGQRTPIPFKLKETKDRFTLRTKELTLEVDRSPIRFTLKDKKGNVLVEDDNAFGLNAIGTEVTHYRKLQPAERFLGLGEKVGPIDKRGQSYTNYNTDTFGYSVEQDPLYLTIPFFIGHHVKGCYGYFLDNSHQTTFNFGASSNRFSWTSITDGEFDLYLFGGQDIPAIIRAYTALTGRMKLPPKWSLGYQQCRYSYYPDDEVKTLATTFRDKQIPADVIYLDIHYMEEYKAFTFDDKRFPNPKKMMAELADKGFKVVCIVDPGIKVQKGYGTYDRGVKKDVFVKMPDGERYQGEVWPSWSHFPDYTSERARKWWGEELKFYHKLGVKGIWNDMNEPAAWGQSLPGFLEFDHEGEGAAMREARNVYGMQMARATAEGMQKHMKEERNFVLTRAGFSGVQRFSAVWTGDNVSSDEHLLLTSRMLQGMGLSGISFAGADVGGFVGEASPALFARWIALGAFQPMYRSHTQVNTRDAEPWSFGEEVEQIARNYISLRYQMLPYIYSCMHRSTVDGYDSSYDNQYYFGEGLLVVPAESNETLRRAYLPKKTAEGKKAKWLDFYTDTPVKSGEIVADCPVHKLPLYVRQGSILPFQQAVQHTAEKHDGILRLHVYPGADGSLDFYEDDGLTVDSTTAERNIVLKGNTLTIGKQKGSFSSEFKKVAVIFHGLTRKKSVTIDGKKKKLETRSNRFVQPISGIDTFFEDKGRELEADVQCVETVWKKSEIKLSWT